MENREQGNYTILVEHLNLTFKDCLIIIIYKKEDTNNKFQKKLIEFLYRTYDEIEDKFGEETAIILECITKISHLKRTLRRHPFGLRLMQNLAKVEKVFIYIIFMMGM